MIEGVITMRRLILLALAGITLTGCTQAFFAKATRYGSSGQVTCYSGGHAVFSDRSTGAIHNEDHSDGYYFVAASTHRLTEVSGQCIIDYGN